MREIAIADAEEKAIKEVLDEGNPVKLESIKPESKVKMDPNATPFVPSFPAPSQIPESQNNVENNVTLKELETLQEKQTELSSMLIKQHKTSHLPAKEPPVFTGDVFDYPAFITAFDSVISNNVPSNRDKLYFLEKHTKGKANNIVEGFLSVNSESAYDEARKLLDQRFGNPVYVAEAYKTRGRNWPQIIDGDSSGLQDFSDFLVRCQEAVRTVGSLAELNSTQTLRQMSAKHPSYCAVKCCRHAHDMQAKSGKRVAFTEFVKFVKQESDLANDPIFSPDALRREKHKPPERNQWGRGRRRESNSAGSFAINTTPSATSKQSSGYQTSRCPFCGKGHTLERCVDLKSKHVDERIERIESLLWLSRKGSPIQKLPVKINL